MISNILGSSLNPFKGRSLQQVTGTFNIPQLAFSSATNSSVVTSIANYDASFTYGVSSGAGSVSRSTSSVTVSGLSQNQSTSVTVTATGSKGVVFSTTQNILSLPDTPTLSRTGGSTSSINVQITNYLSDLTYSIGTSAGSISRTGNTLSVTGLSDAQAATITVTATNATGSSSPGTLATGSMPNTPTLAFSSRTTSSIDWTISNYNAAFSYSATNTGGSGSASVSTNTATRSGMAQVEGGSISVIATANGVSSAAGTASSYTTGSITFTSSTSWVVPNGLTSLTYSIRGAAGGGGAGGDGSATWPGDFTSPTTIITHQGGGGGGGGGRGASASGTLSVTQGSTLSIVVGAVGAGGIGGFASGGSGGSSSISSITANGGGGGGAGWPPPGGNPGGAGGTGGSSGGTGGAAGSAGSNGSTTNIPGRPDPVPPGTLGGNGGLGAPSSPTTRVGGGGGKGGSGLAPPFYNYTGRAGSPGGNGAESGFVTITVT